MKESVPRIRKVKFKSGGELSLLPAPKNAQHKEICRYAQQIADTVQRDWDDLHGFLVVFWDRTGDYRAGWRYSALTEGQPISPTLVPAFVHDILLRERVDKNIEMVTGERPWQGDL